MAVPDSIPKKSALCCSCMNTGENFHAIFTQLETEKTPACFAWLCGRLRCRLTLESEPTSLSISGHGGLARCTLSECPPVQRAGTQQATPSCDPARKAALSPSPDPATSALGRSGELGTEAHGYAPCPKLGRQTQD